MTRVLLIARYYDATMLRKVSLLRMAADMAIRYLGPQYWQNDLVRFEQQPSTARSSADIAVPLLGRPSDPHWTVYRSLTLGLSGYQPQIIHAEEEPDSLAALQVAVARRLFAPRARLILNTWQNVDRPRRAEVRWVTRQTLRAADGVMCANAEAQSILRRHGYHGYTEVLPAIGVDTETFRPCPDRPARQSFVAGYIGRLAPEKGIGTLLEALARLDPEFELRLVGGGPDSPALQAHCRVLGLADRVQFVPPMPPAKVAAYLCQLDALVLPSLTTQVWKEQFGRVLTEAMACGVPVVGSNSGAIPEVIGQAGLIFPEGDAAALADHLQQLQGSPALRQKLAQLGLARARGDYAQSVIAARTVAVYRHLLNEPGHDTAA